MKVTRIDKAEAYAPSNHFDCVALRLQGYDVSESQNFWVGLSHILPNGGTTMEGTPLEKVYVVLTGEITIVTKEGRTKLGVHDSCHIPADEVRQVINETTKPASMIVIMPYPEGKR